jgi:RyR domain
MSLPPDRLDAISRTVHEALRGWAAAHGQHDIPGWDEAPDWMHASTRESVLHALENGGADGRSQHDQWLAQKARDGWAHGPVKDTAAKTHPLMIPYDQLPDWERRKDALINALARALA